MTGQDFQSIPHFTTGIEFRQEQIVPVQADFNENPENLYLQTPVTG